MAKSKASAAAMLRAARFNAEAATRKTVEAQRANEKATAKATNKARKAARKQAEKASEVTKSKLSAEELTALQAKCDKSAKLQKAYATHTREGFNFIGGVPLVAYNEGVRYAN